MPVAAVALSALILNGAVGMIEIIGIVFILCGVWIVHLQTSRLAVS